MCRDKRILGILPPRLHSTHLSPWGYVQYINLISYIQPVLERNSEKTKEKGQAYQRRTRPAEWVGDKFEPVSDDVRVRRWMCVCVRVFAPGCLRLSV